MGNHAGSGNPSVSPISIPPDKILRGFDGMGPTHRRPHPIPRWATNIWTMIGPLIGTGPISTASSSSVMSLTATAMEPQVGERGSGGTGGGRRPGLDGGRVAQCSSGASMRGGG